MSDENIENNQPETAEEKEIEHNYDFATDISAFSDVKINLKAILGSAKMTIGQFLKISRGSILELDQKKDSNLNVLVNNYKVAEGEVLLDDEDMINVEIKNVYKHKKY